MLEERSDPVGSSQPAHVRLSESGNVRWERPRVDSEGLKPAALSVSHQNNYSKMFYRCCNNNGTVSTFHLE